MEGEEMSRDIFKTISATNHSNTEREENDFYATSPSAARFLIDLEDLSSNIWECACGQGHLSKVFAENGYNVKSTDLIDRGYGESGVDFLKQTERFNGDIVTNPPYKYAKEFVEKALSIITDGHKVCMFLKLTFAEGKTRRSLFKNTPPEEFGYLLRE